MTTEKRRHPRRQANHAARIMVPVACTLLDISRGGARLRTAKPQLLPEQFVLELRVGLNRWCRVVRRGVSEVAVEFIDPPVQ